jgi:hypothetical protein
MTGWIKPDGSERRVPPAQLGMLRDGHHVKLGSGSGETSAWDFSFESKFDQADSRFPAVISWLQGLIRKPRLGGDIRHGYLPQSASDEQLRTLTECVVSLAVRSPMNREASVGHAEYLGPPLSARQRNAVIGANMAHSQRIIADSIGVNAKFAVLFSENREFIFGDGFFHNVKACVNPPHNPKIIAPITPEVAVIITRPMAYMVEPRLSTLALTDDEVDMCNRAVQVFSRNALFYRSQPPHVDDEFRSAQHLVYARPENPMDRLIRSVPGVLPNFPGDF